MAVFGFEILDLKSRNLNRLGSSRYKGMLKKDMKQKGVNYVKQSMNYGKSKGPSENLKKLSFTFKNLIIIKGELF